MIWRQGKASFFHAYEVYKTDKIRCLEKKNVGHFFTCKTHLLRKTGTLYINQIIFYHFLQILPILLVKCRYRVERRTLVWQRFNHRAIFALFQLRGTACQPNHSAPAWTSGNQRTPCLVGTLGVAELPVRGAVNSFN